MASETSDARATSTPSTISAQKAPRSPVVLTQIGESAAYTPATSAAKSCTRVQGLIEIPPPCFLLSGRDDRPSTARGLRPGDPMASVPAPVCAYQLAGISDSGRPVPKMGAGHDDVGPLAEDSVQHGRSPFGRPRPRGSLRIHRKAREGATHGGARHDIRGCGHHRGRDDESDHGQGARGRSELGADLRRRAGAVVGGGAGDLRDQQRQPGPHHHPAGQLPGPGRLRHLRVRARRRGRHRPADLHRLRLWRRAGRARRLPRYSMRDGIVLGAAVGFGFAAFESAGYAFNALFTTSGPSLLNLVETEVLRGILAPVGHGLWTAILGGALFAAAARRGRPRLRGAVAGWYLLVAALHGLWDGSQQLAVWLTLLLTGTPVPG